MLNIKEDNRKIDWSPKKSTNVTINEMQKIKIKLANQAEVIDSMKKSLVFFKQSLWRYKKKHQEGGKSC